MDHEEILCFTFLNWKIFKKPPKVCNLAFFPDLCPWVLGNKNINKDIICCFVIAFVRNMDKDIYLLICFFPSQMSWRPTYRSSKFRNVYGKVANREHCFDGIPITKNVHDNHFCAVNSKFLAVVTESAGGGSFIVIPVAQVTDPIVLLFVAIPTKPGSFTDRCRCLHCRTLKLLFFQNFVLLFPLKKVF